MSSTSNVLSFLAAAYAVPATLLSGVFGVAALPGQDLVNTGFISTDEKTGIVTEIVDSNLTGIPFFIMGNTLTRTWDFNAGEVCNYDSTIGLFVFVPVIDTAMDCSSIDNFANKDHVEKARSLALPPIEQRAAPL